MSAGKVQKDRAENFLIVSSSKQVEKKMEEGEQLLPGVPDEITLDQIAPKLPWTAFYILSSVSRGWQRAIQSRQVYDARVRSKSTQTLVALSDQTSQYINRIALFSIKDGSCYHLPPIPGVQSGIPWGYGCISLDGKLYVIGGIPESSRSDDYASAGVYMFDVAGQSRWKQCAGMKDARYISTCGVKDGKIFVFGDGSLEWKRSWASEVYDPQEDVWSPIASVPSFRWSPKVTTVGDELFVHSGQIQIPEWTPSTSFYHYIPGHMEDAVFAEVYHPHKDRWRTLKHFTQSGLDQVLMVRGKLHKLNQDGIEVYDIDENSWQPLQPISFGGSEPSYFSVVQVVDAVAVDDEILAVVEWTMIDVEDGEMENTEEDAGGYCLIKSQGVGGKNAEILWQRLKCSMSVEFDTLLLCLLQL